AVAWNGVAYSRIYRGDWKAGRDALQKRQQAEPLPEDRFSAAEELAMTLAVIPGRMGEAQAILRTAQQQSGAAGLDGVRAHVLAREANERGAFQHFARCIDADSVCQLERFRALEAAGDKAGAQAVRTELLSVYRRSAGHLFARAQLDGIPPAVSAATK